MNPISRRAASFSLFALAALTLGLAGCGGGGDNDNDSTPSPYRGEYPGTYDVAAVGEFTRQLQVTISASGAFQGTATSVIPNSGTVTLTGEVSRTGRFEGSVTFANGSSAEYAGNLVQNANGYSAVLTSSDPEAPEITLTIGYIPV